MFRGLVKGLLARPFEQGSQRKTCHVGRLNGTDLIDCVELIYSSGHSVLFFVLSGCSRELIRGG